MAELITIPRKDFLFLVECVAAINARGRKKDLYNRDLALICLNNAAVQNGDASFTGIEACAARTHATALTTPLDADIESIRRQMRGVWVHEEFKEEPQ